MSSSSFCFIVFNLSELANWLLDIGELDVGESLVAKKGLGFPLRTELNPDKFVSVSYVHYLPVE